jgi:hypothetical protein
LETSDHKEVHPMQVTARALRDEDDFWRMRALLSATFPITPMGLNWDVRRLDGKRYYAADLAANRLQARPVQLWETAGGELVGYVLAEGRDDAHLQIHPDYRHLEPEMVAWAEAHLGAAAEEGGRALEIYTYEYDALKQRLLADLGYTKMDYGGMIRHLRIGQQPLPPPEVADRLHPAHDRPGRSRRLPAHRRPAQRRLWPHLSQRPGVSQLHTVRSLFPPRPRPGDGGARRWLRRVHRHPLR